MDVFSSKENNLRLNEELQSKIEVLSKQALKKKRDTIYPFNPNYITDYKGYTLGMSVIEIDRIQSFRKTNKYVNSATEFQKVTQVSDSLLLVISPHFKFPDWTKKRASKSLRSAYHQPKKIKTTKAIKIVEDINLVTAEKLREINGIGEKLSARIIKFRDRLGGFLVIDQLYDVYGLEDVVVKRVLALYVVKNKPAVVLININSATAYEISKLLYINYNLAKQIVSYRDKNGAFVSFNDLLGVKGFPANKIDRIKLYLTVD